MQRQGFLADNEDPSGDFKNPDRKFILYPVEREREEKMTTF